MSEYDVFAADYDVWAAEMTEDVGWYVELAREAEGPIVELAVGSGRVAIPIARETGKRVIGIDRSPAMLAAARERIAAQIDGERMTREGGRWQVIRNVPAYNRIDITRGRGDETHGVIHLWWGTKAEWDGLIDVAGSWSKRCTAASTASPSTTTPSNTSTWHGDHECL
jgi:SAM-dependent methyltransferase